jgi:hypothetical protein
MLMSNQRQISRKLVQKIGKSVGEIAWQYEAEWEYALPEFSEPVRCISIGRDGTTTPIIGEGYRETMCGTISFYGKENKRLHTIYKACAPEKGKESFDQSMDKELAEVIALYPDVERIGLADGALNNWTYLNSRTTVQLLDFYHASDHLNSVSYAMRSKDEDRKEWYSEACHDLKNKRNGAKLILQELEQKSKEFGGQVPEVLSSNITYFTNNLSRMNYYLYLKQGYPIGSGVTEAACKVVAKQRLNNSGMRWHIENVEYMLLCRELICTEGRWEQFWQFIDKKRA